MIGVMPKKDDYQKTSIWGAYTSFSSESTISFSKIIIVEDFSEAKYFLEKVM